MNSRCVTAATRRAEIKPKNQSVRTWHLFWLLNCCSLSISFLSLFPKSGAGIPEVIVTSGKEPVCRTIIWMYFLTSAKIAERNDRISLFYQPLGLCFGQAMHICWNPFAAGEWLDLSVGFAMEYFCSRCLPSDLLVCDSCYPECFGTC